MITKVAGIEAKRPRLIGVIHQNDGVLLRNAQQEQQADHAEDIQRLAGGQERDGAIAIALPRQLDAATDDIEPRADERLDPVQPRLLRGIVGTLPAQALQ